MAFTYTDKPVLSKVKIGEQYYYLKDADVRAILDAINANVYEKLKLDLGAIKDGNKQNGLAVVSDIKAYVDEMKEIAFDVVKVDATVVASATVEKYNLYRNSIVLVENQGAAAGSCIEYVIIKDGEASYKWEQIGTTKVDLTDYVEKTLTIAGIDLQDNITKEELQTALGLKALAYKDSAKGTISTADSATLNYTPEGTVNVTLAQTAKEVASAGKFTPKGSITGSAISGGSIAVTLKDAAVASDVSLTKGDYTPAGTISKPAITLTKGTAKAVVTGVTSAGTAPSLETGFYTAGSAATYSHTGFSGGSLGAASKALFATEGIKATVGTEGNDAECLIFSAATTSNAVTEQGQFTAAVYGTDTFNGGSATIIDTSKFNAGSMPTFSTGSVDVIESAALAEAPKFTGTVATDALVTGATYVKQVVDAATFNGTAATLEFSGTEGDVAVTGSYNEASVQSAAFTGTAAATNAVTLNKTNKDVTVE